MTEVQAVQLKLVGIHNIKKIFSTEKLLLRASSFLFQIKYSHCENAHLGLSVWLIYIGNISSNITVKLKS